MFPILSQYTSSKLTLVPLKSNKMNGIAFCFVFGSVLAPSTNDENCGVIAPIVEDFRMTLGYELDVNDTWCRCVNRIVCYLYVFILIVAGILTIVQ